ncbi:hypothetical protein BsWGS_03325 [Bradybaena similaris]
MSLSTLMLVATIYCATARTAIAEVNSEYEEKAAIDRNERDINDEKMAAVSKYWTTYSSRRTEALNQCESRLFRYSNRRKQAQELFINVVRRYSKAEVADVKLAQQNTEMTETALRECVQQIIALHGEDAFYSEYQFLSADLQRLTDQVASCLEAGGHITSAKIRSTANFDEQVVARLSPQMLRVYDSIQRLTAAKDGEKTICFSSLAIPANFPVQLEVVTA